MEDEVKTWLTDIKRAIVEINGFLPGKKDFLQFKRDVKTKRAIERNIEIIGEAANRVLARSGNKYNRYQKDHQYQEQDNSWL